MKKLTIIPLVILIATFLIPTPNTANAWGGTFTNPIVPWRSATPDPWITYKDGYYYFTFTTGGNITVWKSRSLTNMDDATKAVVWTPPPDTMYSKNLWAPEIHWIDGKWYIYFAADNGENKNHRMYVLQSKTEDALGEYSFKGQIFDPKQDKWGIDGTVLQLEDQNYYIWSGWEGAVNVRQILYIAPMKNPWTLSGERVELSRPEYDWETVGDPDINEGPVTFKKNGKVFLLYSGSGSWTPEYKIGMLTLDIGDNPLVQDNWTKSPEPVFQRNDEASVYGPGHPSVTVSPDGTEHWLVYHATSGENDGWANRKARIQKIEWKNNGIPDFGEPIATSTALDAPSGDGKIEAEYADEIQRATVQSDKKASNGKTVSFKNADSYAHFDNINVGTSGVYPVTIKYRNPAGPDVPGQPEHGKQMSVQYVSVNGDKVPVTYRQTGRGNWAYTTIDVSLQAGTNSIRFTNSDSNLELDYIELPRYEAESAVVHEASRQSDNKASDGGKVGNLNDAESSVQFRNIHVAETGTYTLRVGYANSSGQVATQTVKVNNRKPVTLEYPATDGKWSMKTVKVKLKAGSNTITFLNGKRAIELDYIDIYQDLTSQRFSLDMPEYLSSGKNTITSTFENLGTHAVNDVQLNLDAPEGWSVEAVSSVNFEHVPPGERVHATWEVTPSDGTLPLMYDFQAEATYEFEGESFSIDAQDTRRLFTDTHGLKANYFISSEPGVYDFYQHQTTIVDPNINFSNFEPILNKLTGQSDYVTVRWTGQIQPQFSEAYRFHMVGDNGFRLWIDGKLMIDHWVSDWNNPQISEPIKLEAGKKYEIKVEYFEDWGGSNLKLSWSSPSQPKEVIPFEALYLPEEFEK